MKLTFLGTRAYIETRSAKHERHSSLLVRFGERKVMVDAGEDWRGALHDIGPDAIVITHSHPDHCWALKGGSPCPVFATEIAWEAMRNFPIHERHVVAPRKPLRVADVTFEAFRVEHSTVAPAVGYRIAAGASVIFYSPDVIHVHERNEALVGAHLYIGDGATIKRQLVRKHGENLVGHASIQTQIAWCQKERVPEAIFTHCGSDIVNGSDEEITELVSSLGEERDIRASVAFDGMELALE